MSILDGGLADESADGHISPLQCTSVKQANVSPSGLASGRIEFSDMLQTQSVVVNASFHNIQKKDKVTMGNASPRNKNFLGKNLNKKTFKLQSLR